MKYNITEILKNCNYNVIGLKLYATNFGYCYLHSITKDNDIVVVNNPKKIYTPIKYLQDEDWCSYNQYGCFNASDSCELFFVDNDGYRHQMWSVFMNNFK